MKLKNFVEKWKTVGDFNKISNTYWAYSSTLFRNVNYRYNDHSEIKFPLKEISLSGYSNGDFFLFLDFKYANEKLYRELCREFKVTPQYQNVINIKLSGQPYENIKSYLTTLKSIQEIPEDILQDLRSNIEKYILNISEDKNNLIFNNNHHKIKAVLLEDITALNIYRTILKSIISQENILNSGKETPLIKEKACLEVKDNEVNTCEEINLVGENSDCDTVDAEN